MLGSVLESRERTPAALLVDAESALVASDVDTAKGLAAQAVAIAEAAGDAVMHARAITVLARVLYVRHDIAEAMSCVLTAIDLSTAMDDLPTLAKAHHVAARILVDTGDTTGGLEEGVAAMEAADSCGDLEAISAAARAMCNVYAALRQWERALTFAERYHEATRLLGDPTSECSAIDTVSFCYGGMASEAAERGDHEQAAELHEHTVVLSRWAMLMAREAGARRTEATAVANLAESLADCGRPQEGLDLLDSWPADPTRDTVPTIGHHRQTRGIILLALGRREEAAELLRLSIAEAPTRSHEINARRALASLLEDTGDLSGALTHYKRMLALLSDQASERAQLAAGVAAVRLETAQAQARALALANEAADLHENSEKLRRQAMEDPLTGLPNRRRLDELLASDLTTSSVVILDVDHFKRVNDDHSHLVGDSVLRVLAGLMRGSCRQGDTVARFGGEEFAMVMRGVSREGAIALAERTRQAVEGYDWASLAPGIAVTASFGAALGTEATTSIELLALADSRLRAAKAAGRNRVVGPPA
ncbi:hypothetical protein Cch01nite_37630 [Cellulomonas chitinilytica]|uniref:GGDEF domain-containing protein n=1 Tax=Cellulomonas chitinilytica TaxID=398759 RepID=A0A919P8U2_9CELL|nr:GGDEF domain-containing protein [Cellulomonas chitinilytica]GIG23039.1 hypothetical protein Cch01nite_37630 [Cellulomonas chitinilytica]